MGFWVTVYRATGFVAVGRMVSTAGRGMQVSQLKDGLIATVPREPAARVIYTSSLPR